MSSPPEEAWHWVCWKLSGLTPILPPGTSATMPCAVSSMHASSYSWRPGLHPPCTSGGAATANLQEVAALRDCWVAINQTNRSLGARAACPGWDWSGRRYRRNNI